MVAAISMSDLARQKRLDIDLNGDNRLSSSHSVGQAVDLYLDRMQIPDRGLRWTAFSRGVMLDGKRRLGDLDFTDTDWTVMPEVSAG